MRWQIKAAIQCTFSLLPGGEVLNHWAQNALGSHAPQQLLKDFRRQHAHLSKLNERFPLEGKTVLEIGTGWNGIGIILFALAGAREIHSFDHLAHLRLPLAQQLLRVIVDSEPDLRERAQTMLQAGALNEFLAAANATYYAPADAARTGLPAKSVDLIFSYGVLEHIPAGQLERITKESARVLRGRAYHRIGLHDHYQSIDPSLSAVNFLQYPDWFWNLINNRIGYHNRLRSKHYLDLFARHGGTIVYREDDLRARDLEALKTIKVRVFADLTPEELAMSQMDVDVVFPGEASAS